MYEYVLLIKPTVDELEKYELNMPYRILNQDHRAHILFHEKEQTMAYALFDTDWIIPHGLVKMTEVPVMIMIKNQP